MDHIARVYNLQREAPVAKVHDVSKVDGTYFLYFGEGARALAEEIFGASVREGITFTKQELSRKQIVPLINNVLK